jgi:hypothetical protein
VSSGVPVLRAQDQLIRVCDGFAISIHAEHGCLSSDIDLCRKGVVGLAEMNDTACFGPAVPVVVWVVHGSASPGIDKEEIGHTHLISKVWVEFLYRLEEVIGLETGKDAPVLSRSVSGIAIK